MEIWAWGPTGINAKSLAVPSVMGRLREEGRRDC